MKDIEDEELQELKDRDVIRQEARNISLFVLSLVTGYVSKCKPELRFEAKQIMKKRLKGVLETL